MDAGIARYESPEERELARRRLELIALEEELTEGELQLESLKTDLRRFEVHYIREVGALYAELDEWKAKSAELKAEAAGTLEARAAADAAHAEAKASREAVEADTEPPRDFTPSVGFKKLYRDVVNQVHPDRAGSDADRVLRERLIKEANAAFSRGDEDSLRSILEEYRTSPEAVKGDDAAADLDRTLRMIRRIRNRIAQIEEEIANLTASEMAKLLAQVETAAEKGRDLLAEMADDLRRRIAVERR